MRMKERNIRGFTLLEILIVISILAILAMAVVPNFVGFDTEAKVAAIKNWIAKSVNTFIPYCAQNHILECRSKS